MPTYTQAYAKTHSIIFLSDSLRNTLREIIRENGLDPALLMQDWANSPELTFERGSIQVI